jgi:hypothetical protein
MRRHVIVAATAVVVALAAAPAAPAHVLTSGTAEAIAERYNRQVAARAPWVAEWGSECSRETPWTFSCNAQIWDPSRWCWQWFNVVQPNFGAWGRPRIEDVEPWACEAT